MNDENDPHAQITDPDVALRLMARAENVAVVRHALNGLSEALDIDEELMADINLAVGEACSNVVVHAYDGDEGPMEVFASVGKERIVVAVRDRGRGIAPRADSPGLGVGLPLMATLSETLELRECGDHETEVLMSFARAGGGA